jgi:hypothetical protein
MERTVKAIPNVTNGTNVSNQAERPPKTIPKLDSLSHQWTMMTLRECVLQFVKIAA